MKHRSYSHRLFLIFIPALFLVGFQFDLEAQGQAASTSPRGSNARSDLVRLNSSGSVPNIDWKLRADGYKTLAARDPANAVVQNNLGVAYAMQSQYDASILAFEEATRLDPGLSRAFLNLAVVLGRVSRTDESYAAVQTAVELSPEDVGARSIMCETALGLGRAKEALACYGHLVKISEPDAFTLANYGMALILNKEFSSAVEILSSSIEKLPQQTSVYNALGVAYFNMKKFDEAAAALKSATEIDPENDQARFNLGVVQLAKRNRAAALSQYRLLKESNPKLADQLYKMMYRGMIVDVSGR